MNAILGRVSDSGRLSLPSTFRNTLGLEHGGDVVVEMSDGAIHIRTLDQTSQRARELTKRLLADKPGSDVDGFLADRHREAEGG
jgi:AbrB family looped-hinge helix DNA binding protein